MSWLARSYLCRPVCGAELDDRVVVARLRLLLGVHQRLVEVDEDRPRVERRWQPDAQTRWRPVQPSSQLQHLELLADLDRKEAQAEICRAWIQVSSVSYLFEVRVLVSAEARDCLAD